MRHQTRSLRHRVAILVFGCIVALAAGPAVAQTTASPAVTITPAPNGPLAGIQNLLNTQATTISQLQQQIQALQAQLACISPTSTSTDLYFSGCNVHVLSGAGATDAKVNGLGNLIIGYNELRNDGSDQRTGSHNLVVGNRNNYASYGGLVAGQTNSVTGPFASVTGGEQNTASGHFSSVNGGETNSANGEGSSVSGGGGNTVNGIAFTASVCGGQLNQAIGLGSSVSGGTNNQAIGNLSSVSGGENNFAIGDDSSVSGGNGAVIFGTDSWAAGGSFHNP